MENVDLNFPLRILNGKNIAVIGNALSLFEKNYGKEIDSHDFIIRMNRAAILMLEKERTDSHGTRTDMWCMWRFREYENVSLEYPPYMMQMSTEEKTTKVYQFPQKSVDELSIFSGVQTPSTGLRVLYWLANCNVPLGKVSAYGFDWKASPTFTDPNREWDNEFGALHDFAKERNMCIHYFQKERGFSFK